MNELLASLQQKTGLSPDKAQDAVQHVLDFLKARLPASLHPHLDTAANGGSITDSISGAAGSLGSLFGK